VDIRCNQALGKDFTIQSLQADGYQAIVLALGAHKSRRLGIPGDELPGAYHGVQLLRDIALGQPADVKGKRVVVVGGGDVAIDAARSTWRLGASEVHVVYRREKQDMPAHPEEIQAAEEEGIQFHFLANPVAVLGDDKVTAVRLQRQAPGDYDLSGRRAVRGVPGSEFDVLCDVLVPAIGQVTDFDWMTDDSVQTNRLATFKTGRALETTIAGVFAAGDAVSGPATVIDAVAQGNKVALAVDNWLTTGKVSRIVYRPKWHMAEQTVNVLDYAQAKRPEPRMLPPEVRRQQGFAEVELDYDETTAQEEARRCLRCDLEWLQLVGEMEPAKA
jgi:NADH-quinone oxidoreductase subunit F